ncbi:MAG: outer membrane protein transport protein [Arenicellales bacterium]
MTNNFKKLAISTAIASVMALPMTASATNGILAYGNGIVAHGMGGAGVANAGEGMSAVDNPALAARVGAGWSVQLSAFNPNRSANVGRGYVESDKSWFPIPGGHWFTNVGDGLVAGVTVSALGGMNTTYPAQLFGVPVGIDLSGVIIAPTISANVTENVSIGGALLIGYEILESTGPGQPPLPRNEKDTATGLGIEIGVAIDVAEGTTIGIDFQSKIDMDEFEKHNMYLFGPTKAAGLNAQLTIPSITTVGISHKINDQWKVHADVASIPWSDIDVIATQFGWEDQTVYKIGAEMQMNSDTTLRFGYNFGESPIPDAKAGNNILAPATTEKHYTIGFTKNMGNGKLHGYYARIPNNEQKQAGAPGGLPSIQMDQNAFGLAYEVQL